MGVAVTLTWPSVSTSFCVTLCPADLALYTPNTGESKRRGRRGGGDPLDADPDAAVVDDGVVEGEGQPPRPADLRTVNVMSWCPFAGVLYHMEVALFQHQQQGDHQQQQQSQVQPATMPRFKYTGRIQVLCGHAYKHVESRIT